MGARTASLSLLCIVLISVCYGRESCSRLPPLFRNETGLVVDLIGNFYLVATIAGELKWSFSSGFPIYSSYRRCLPDEEYIDCDDNFNLFYFRNATKIRVADVNGVHVGEQARFIFGIDYVFDAISGRLVDIYASPSMNMGKVFEPQTVKQRLYIRMTHVAYKNLDERGLKWNVSYSDFKASFEYEGFTELLPVHRVRDRNLLESPIHVLPVCPPTHRSLDKSLDKSRIKPPNWIVPRAIYVLSCVLGVGVLTYVLNTWKKDITLRKGVIEILKEEVIGRGSNGTIVFKGFHQGRVVAVKKVFMVEIDKRAAIKEKDILLKVQDHDNVVKFYAYEAHEDFEYLALEICRCNLEELIEAKSVFEDVVLWKADDSPTSQLIKLMRDIFCGIRHFHQNDVLHRDLNPRNVLIKSLKYEPFIRALVSDVGRSKSISSEPVSPGLGSGTSCWQAQEQLRLQPQTRATDWFSFGCILFYAVSRGGHPFGDESVAEENIKKGNFDLSLIQSSYEAADLVERLLNHDPVLRPIADQILGHPFFWDAQRRMLFLKDASDWLNAVKIDRPDFENEANKVFQGTWDAYLESDHKLYLSTKELYKCSLFSLLRSIRNAHNHFPDLPPNVQQILRDKYDGLLEYYTDRFKNLLIVVYRFVEARIRSDSTLIEYFP